MTELTRFDFQEIKANIENGIEEWSINHYPLEFRNHLGISEIGEACSRKIWYKFRWMGQEYFDGRMRRLFARGHREEEKYISYLEGIGCKVYRFQDPILNYHPESDDYFLSAQFDPGNGHVEDVTGLERHEVEALKRGLKRKQFRVSGVMGHYGGSTDGVIITPWYPDPFIAEFKTHNTKSFTGYVKDGLKKAKPQHWSQMNGYGEKMQIKYGIYFPENKNDDDIKVEVVKLDWEHGKQLERKAEEIILAKEPPPKISENPAYFNCQYCFMSDVCHKGAIPIKNCRSCRNATPTENATWTCSRFGVIPTEFIPKACDEWIPL